MVFTRGGKPLHRAVYLKKFYLQNEKDIPQPTIYIRPKCVLGKELKLPSVTATINYGTYKFQWTSDIRELFEVTYFEGKPLHPLNISKQHSLLNIKC